MSIIFIFFINIYKIFNDNPGYKSIHLDFVPILVILQPLLVQTKSIISSKPTIYIL